MKRDMTGLTLVLLMTIPAAFAAPGMKSITRDKVNVRTGPGQTHDVFYRAPLGYPVEIERSRGDWLCIKDWEGDSGWVHRSLVGNVRTIVVLRDEVNLRRGPGLRQPVLNKTTRGKIYKVLSSKNGWFQLGYYDTNEDAGWVRGDLVWGQ